MTRLFGASIAVFVGMLALLFAIGMLVISRSHLPREVALMVAGAFAVSIVLIQYLAGPALIDWIVKVRWSSPRELSGEFDQWMAATCRQFRIPEPRFGIIEEAAPNAFTYGHGPWDARVVVTRGLVEMLDPLELKAVVAHELGHIKHRDFIIMTLVQALVTALWAIYIMARTNRRAEAVPIMMAAYIAYWLGYLTSLLLSRIREYMADYASAQILQNGNPLCGALVKIAYGLAKTETYEVAHNPQPLPQTAGVQQASAQRVAPVVAPASASPYDYDQKIDLSITDGRVDRAASAEVRAKVQKIEDDAKEKEVEVAKKAGLSLQSLGAFGVCGLGSMRSAVAWFGDGMTPDTKHFLNAARWELFNPWAKIAEVVSTHPLTALRIKEIQKLNARWGISNEYDLASLKPAKYRGFLRDLLVAFLPLWCALAAYGGLQFLPKPLADWREILVAVGAMIAGFVIKLLIVYPGGFSRKKVLGLVSEVQVSHVRPIPVVLEGVFTGRVSPGVPWANDFILQDDTGFITCLYRQPVFVFEVLFGLFGASKYVGKQVTVYGWYRRFEAPYVEMAHFVVAGTRERKQSWYRIGMMTLALMALAAIGFVIGRF